MTINEYLKITGQTLAEFAAALGCSEKWLWYVANGKRSPSTAFITSIIKASASKITFDGIMQPFGDELPKREPQKAKTAAA